MKLFRKHGLKRELWKHFRSSRTLQLLAVLLVLSVVNVLLSLSGNLYIDRAIRQTEEAARPASLQLVSIVSYGCPECFDVARIANSIKALNVKITGEKTLDSGSKEAKSIIAKYSIARIPALIVSGETAKAGLDASWSKFGTAENDGSLVTRYTAPYVDVATGGVKGRVALINLVDNACSTCYNVSVHKAAFGYYVGFYLSNETTYDISSAGGKALRLKYNITFVPTVLLSPDAAVYAGMKAVWEQFNLGTVEPDNWYVVRNMAVLQGATYRDLSTGNTVTTA